MKKYDFTHKGDFGNSTVRVPTERVITLHTVREIKPRAACAESEVSICKSVLSDVRSVFVDRAKRLLKLRGRVLRFVLVMSLMSAVFPVMSRGLGVYAASAILMVADTGQVLFEHNAHETRSMASTTKILTSLIALEQGTPDRVVTVTKEMAAEGTSMGLKAGDKVTLKSLVYGMLLQSGNDAANAVAYAVSGSIEAFAELMNARAKELGMKNSHFETPSGLDSEGHYTTAYDMALLGCAAIGNPEFFAICSDKSERISFVEPATSVTYSNHNRLLHSYKGAVGIKTGFTKKSGRCLVSAATRKDVTLVAVTLNDGNDWNDHMNMLDYGFEKVKTELLETRNRLFLKVVGGKKDSISVSIGGNNAFHYTGELPADMRSQVLMKSFEYAPLSRGDIVGEVRFYVGDRLVNTAELVADEGVEAMPAPVEQKKEPPWYRRLVDRLFNRNGD